MSDNQTHRLRWRGQITGPYPAAEIERMLDDHEIGLLHEIEDNERWMSLEEFLQGRRARSFAETRDRLPPASPPVPLAYDVPAMPTAPRTVTPYHFEDSLGNSGSKSDAPNSAIQPPRSLKLFLTLGFLAGFTGAHNFYAGYWGMGLVQLSLAILTWQLGFGLFIPWLWAWIELFIIHTDRRGIPMK
jgi:hypothetical protein